MLSVSSPFTSDILQAQKTFLLDDEYPLDDDGYPLRVEETRDYVAKWLPLFALRWMEMDQKPGKVKTFLLVWERECY